MKLDKLREWLDSDEGKEANDRFIEKMIQDQEHQMRWVERFKKWAEPDLNAAIEKLCTWYGSGKYRDREFKKGYEPREILLWVALDYAKENCKECDDDDYLNAFTGDAYYIGDYVIQVMHGQGSCIRVDKLKGPIKPSRREKILEMIEARIKAEHMKHSSSLPNAWAMIAAQKILKSLEELGTEI